MKVAVYDTYVTKRNGKIMHFDILVPHSLTDEEKIYGYGQCYWETKDQAGQPLSTKECRFCHIEEASPEIVEDISRQGYSIIEMQGCYN